MECPLQAKVKDFKYLRVFFSNEGSTERETDRRIGVTWGHDFNGEECKSESVSLHSRCQHDHELWVITRRMTSQ